MRIEKKSRKVNRLADAKQFDFAILKIAFLLTALDGHIDESERAMFAKLADQCKEIDVDQAQKVLRDMEKATQRLLEEKKGKTDKAFLQIFIREADAVCDWGLFVRDSRRVRRAFMMWTAMAMSDGDYSEIERKAILLMMQKVNSFPLIDAGFLQASEKGIAKIRTIDVKLQQATELATSRKWHEKLEAEYARLSSLVEG